MRPWITAAVSAVAALAAAAALVRPELTLTPHSVLLSSLLPVLPTLAVTALAVYGLFAIWLSAAGVIAEVALLRRRLDRMFADHDAGPPFTVESVPGGLLRRLLIIRPAPDGAAMLRRVSPGEVRREIVRLYYLAAARAQFFSALIVLVAVVALGAAQQQGGGLPLVPGPIPTVAAGLAVIGLVLLALLARIAVDVTAEPLIDAIAELPAEAPAAQLLGGALARIEAAARRREAMPATAQPVVLDPFVAAIEHSQQTLGAASERLAATSDRFVDAANKSIAALADSLRASETTAQSANRGSAEAVAAMAQLREAVARLTAMLDHLRTAPAAAETGTTPAGAPRREPPPDLAEELRKLLQEIEAAP